MQVLPNINKLDIEEFKIHRKQKERFNDRRLPLLDTKNPFASKVKFGRK
jgi:hypothetical protein